MKRLLNTLYVTLPKAYLAKSGETIEVFENDELKLKVPLHNLQGIVCFGHITCSPHLMHALCEQNINLAFFNEYGRFLAKVYGKTKGNVLLRKQQYRISDNLESCLKLARPMVIGKIANARVNLQRAIRDHPNIDSGSSVSLAVNKLNMQIKLAGRVDNLDELRGVEGYSANIYFGVFDRLIVAQKDDFIFTERSKRPPIDPMNALLSFLYTLLVHDVTGALEAVGLDPAVGFLHRDRPGRASLALDLMEEFRPYIVDRLVLSLINRQQLKINDFIISETGATTLKESARKLVLTSWQQKKQEQITHVIMKDKIDVGMICHAQAMLLARVIRGDIPIYPPFFVK